MHKYNLTSLCWDIMLIYTYNSTQIPIALWRDWERVVQPACCRIATFDT